VGAVVEICSKALQVLLGPPRHNKRLSIQVPGPPHLPSRVICQEVRPYGCMNRMTQRVKLRLVPGGHCLFLEQVETTSLKMDCVMLTGMVQSAIVHYA